MSSKYLYPAIFSPEKEGGYSVLFPDLEGCYTCGDSLKDSLEMAEDALALVLYGYEKDGRKIPEPSKRESLILKNNEFVNYIICGTMVYRKGYYKMHQSKNCISGDRRKGLTAHL